MWKNLLPQGTRTVELCSGYALVITAGLLLAGALAPLTELEILDKSSTWAPILLIFGFLQIYSIYQYPRMEVLRTIMSWAAGVLWLWVSVVSFSYQYHIEDVGVLMLGIGNLYGFVINFNQLHIAWKH